MEASLLLVDIRGLQLQVLNYLDRHGAKMYPRCQRLINNSHIISRFFAVTPMLVALESCDIIKLAHHSGAVAVALMWPQFVKALRAGHYPPLLRHDISNIINGLH